MTAELWGARSPDPLVPAVARRRPGRASARASSASSDAIEIVDWVAHDERRARLARADAAVTLDPGGIEARYAFRTRLVDALAAGLPIIATTGELVADEAAARGAGFTVPAGNPDALAELLVDARRRSRAAHAARARMAPARRRRWDYERTVAPLAAWCRDRGARAPGHRPSARRRAGVLVGGCAAALQRALNSSTSAS